ncbi:glycosyltransferase [Bacillus salinus]|nr:glycosyltransferase [Bacillus sp. HMF5848]
MMITILCAGSRGDFQPYIALAQELKKLGKKVRITGLRS